MYRGVNVSAIVAVADNGVIGHMGDMPWHIPNDLKHFKRTTSGHAMIMGRRTWQSLPGVLPGRPHIVVSRDLEPPAHPAVQIARTPEQALELAANHEDEAVAQGRLGSGEIMVVGGAQLYQLLWPWTDKLYRTRVLLEPEGDTRLVHIDLHDFSLERQWPGSGQPPHIFETWSRRPTAP